MFLCNLFKLCTGKTKKHPLSKLLDEVRSHFKTHEHNPLVVRNSIPILFFGDLGGYQQSKRRIITVALNPSDKEFSELRFDVAPDTFADNNKYLATLSNYFELNPYYNWFNNFEKLLQTMGSSYFSDTSRPQFKTIQPAPEVTRNRVLHTDICSPIATSKTWSKLSSKEEIVFRHSLQTKGSEIWIKLVDYLEPDIILISGGEYLCDYIPVQWEEIALPTDFHSTHRMKKGKFGKARVFWLSGKNTPVSCKDNQLVQVSKIIND
jgi:hypothetical protein